MIQASESPLSYKLMLDTENGSRKGVGVRGRKRDKRDQIAKPGWPGSMTSIDSCQRMVAIHKG